MQMHELVLFRFSGHNATLYLLFNEKWGCLNQLPTKLGSWSLKITFILILTITKTTNAVFQGLIDMIAAAMPCTFSGWRRTLPLLSTASLIVVVVVVVGCPSNHNNNNNNNNNNNDCDRKSNREYSIVGVGVGLVCGHCRCLQCWRNLLVLFSVKLTMWTVPVHTAITPLVSVDIKEM